jgi:hypothetical protein
MAYLIPGPFLSLFASWSPWGELAFCATCSHWHDVLTCLKPKAMKSTDHGLKPLKSWTWLNLFFFMFFVSHTLSQQWKTDLHWLGLQRDWGCRTLIYNVCQWLWYKYFPWSWCDAIEWRLKERCIQLRRLGPAPEYHWLKSSNIARQGLQ